MGLPTEQATFTKLEEMDLEEVNSSLSSHQIPLSEPNTPGSEMGTSVKSASPSRTMPNASTIKQLAKAKEGNDDDPVGILDPEITYCVLFWMVWLAVATVLLYLKLTTATVTTSDNDN